MRMEGRSGQADGGQPHQTPSEREDRHDRPATVPPHVEPGATTDRRTGAGPVVLVIEDEPNIAEAIRFILQRAGWTVCTHDRGGDALEQIEATAPGLVILDVMLPGRSGFDILQGMRSRAGMKGIPVIMLTAKGHTQDRERAERFGVSLFMTKPFANADLLDAVRRLLKQDPT